MVDQNLIPEPRHPTPNIRHQTPNTRHPTPDTRRPSHAGQRAVLALGLLLSLPICFTPISNPDLPWHLSAARFMVQNHEWPRADFLSWTKAGTPWTDFEWGTQLLYYGLHQSGGVIALWLFKALVFIAILLLFVALMRLWKLPDSWTGWALFPLVLSQVPNLDIRPENLSLLFTLLQLYLLESRRLDPRRLGNGRLALAHLILYGLWVNLHAGFLLGLELIFLYFAGELTQTLLPKVYGARGPSDWSRLKTFGLLGLAGFAGSFLNPYGISAYTVPLAHLSELPMLQTHIKEWGEPILWNLYQWPFWGILIFSFLAFAAHFVKTRATPHAHLLILLVLGLSSSSTYRYSAVFCLAVFPLALRALGDIDSPPWWKRARPMILGLGLLALAAVAYRMLVREKLFLKIEEEALKPAAACDFLRKEKTVLSGLRLYNPWGWGGYIGYALQPDYKVFVDGRYIFHEYLPVVRQAKQDPDAWQRFLDGQEIDLVLEENKPYAVAEQAEGGQGTVWRPVERYFMPSRRWALVYWDTMAMVFVRRDRLPSRWLKSREYRFLYPRDLSFLRLQVLQGKVPSASLEAEIRRYVDETGDREQGARLLDWLDGLRKDIRERKLRMRQTR